MVEKGADAGPGRGESSDEREASLGERDSVGEVMLGEEGWGKAVAEPSDYPRWAKD